MADDPERAARRRSFDRKASQYDAARPAYPDALIDDVLARTGARRLVEIGAGPGKATVMLARRGVHVHALEPGASLAALLRANVAAFANVTLEETPFEAWGGDDGTWDLVLAAQAMHWIDPAVRYVKAARALRPGGAVAIVTNEKAPMDHALRDELDVAYGEFLGWPPFVVVDSVATWTAELAASGLFEPPHVGRFPWRATYTSQGYVDLVDTYSDHAVLPDAKRAGLYGAIRAAIDRHGGTIEIPYVALAIVATRRDSA